GRSSALARVSCERLRRVTAQQFIYLVCIYRVVIMSREKPRAAPVAIGWIRWEGPVRPRPWMVHPHRQPKAGSKLRRDRPHRLLTAPRQPRLRYHRFVTVSVSGQQRARRAAGTGPLRDGEQGSRLLSSRAFLAAA